MCEPLERRQLLSATVTTIQADAATLQAEGHTLGVKLNTLLTDFLAAVPSGTAGRKALKTDINEFRGDVQSVMGQVTTDLSIISVDASGPGEANAIAALRTDILLGRNSLKADASDIKNVLVAHPTLITTSAKVGKEKTDVDTAFSAFKKDVTTLKGDLA